MKEVIMVGDLKRYAVEDRENFLHLTYLYGPPEHVDLDSPIMLESVHANAKMEHHRIYPVKFSTGEILYLAFTDTQLKEAVGAVFQAEKIYRGQVHNLKKSIEEVESKSLCQLIRWWWRQRTTKKVEKRYWVE
jgi:hypothetical protein